MDEKILAVARRVARIQAEYDAADHDTTTATFMEDHGPLWSARRRKMMGEIDARRTEAIWALARAIA
jgi:hypothetical protein